MTEHVRRTARVIAAPILAALLISLGSSVSGAAVPARAPAARSTATPATPAPPCTLPASVPAPIASRYVQLGGVRTLGCYDRKSGSNLYVFRTGQIMDIASAYRSGATLAAVIDPGQLIHLYWEAPNMDSYANPHWLVRLSYDGAEVNQQSYAPGDHPYSVGSVQAKYGEDVIVHPGGRHGTVQVGVEACGGGGLISSSSVCLGWGNGTLTFEM